MKPVIRAIAAIHGFAAVLFGCAALALMVIATLVGFQAAAAGFDRAGAQGIIEAVGLLAAAVVALQIAQTILEEEVIRDSHISAPTRVRRFLSRFLVVLVIALALEALVAAFKAIHEDVTHLALCVLAPGGGRRPAGQLGACSSASTATPKSSSPRQWQPPSARTGSSSRRAT